MREDSQSLTRGAMRRRRAARTLAALLLPLALATVVPARPCAAIRHSQAYLARRAAKAAAAAAARNGTRPGVPARPQAAAASPAETHRVQNSAARRVAEAGSPKGGVRYGGSHGAVGYPSNIVAVFKAMRREEEEAADGSAPELPSSVVIRSAACDTRYGAMAFRVLQQQGPPPSVAPLDVVFLHGLGTDGSNCQPPPRAFRASPPAGEGHGGRKWIIPDLLGHGASNVSHDTYAYKMEAQAAGVLAVLQAENVTRCAVLAHSMGGVVAVSLCELCREHGIEVPLLIYCEGNLDAEDDAFHARALFHAVVHKDLWAGPRASQASAVLYWSIVWMMRECCRSPGNSTASPNPKPLTLIL
jgi:hypothetical protein